MFDAEPISRPFGNARAHESVKPLFDRVHEWVITVDHKKLGLMYIGYGILFLVIGLVSAVLLVLELPTWKVGVLLVISIWCFCRFYYFAFYVLERHVDPGFKFAGLWSLIRYVVRGRSSQ